MSITHSWQPSTSSRPSTTPAAPSNHPGTTPLPCKSSPRPNSPGPATRKRTTSSKGTPPHPQPLANHRKLAPRPATYTTPWQRRSLHHTRYPPRQRTTTGRCSRTYQPRYARRCKGGDRKQEDNERNDAKDLLWDDTYGGPDAFLEGAAATYPNHPRGRQDALHALLAYHS